MISTHLTVIIITGLMFLDYYLTIKGYELYRRGYSKHIKIESYELNPLFIESIRNSKYNFRHFLAVIFSIAAIYSVYYLSKIISVFDITLNVLLGVLLSIFIYINSRHIKNILTFRLIEKERSLISGKIRQSYQFSLKGGEIDTLSVLFIYLFIFLYLPSYFTFGFVLGPLMIIWKGKKWAKKYVKDEKLNKVNKMQNNNCNRTYIPRMCA